MKSHKIFWGSLICGIICSGVCVASIVDMPTWWSKSVIEEAIENNILKIENDLIRPMDNLTRAEMTYGINNALGATQKVGLDDYFDVSSEAWYYEDMQKAVAIGIIAGYGDGSLKPEKDITREEMFAILYNALELEEGEISYLDRFNDKDLVSDWAKEIVARMVQNKYVVGTQEGNIRPIRSITREEFAQVMKNIFSKYYNASGTYTNVPEGNIVINISNVVLKDTTITGDLIIADGVGSGEVTLDNVNVLGRVVVRAGGENSIKLLNKTTINGKIIVNNRTNKVRIYNLDSKVYDVELKTSAILEGDFENVGILESLEVEIKGNVSKVVANEKADIKIVFGEVKEIDVGNMANETMITGKGNVIQVNANANDVLVSTSKTKVLAGINTSGVKAGKLDVKPGEFEVVKSSSGGGGSGGGGASSQQVSKPDSEGTKLDEEGTKPGEEGTKPGEEGTKPGEEGTKPGEEGTNPGEEGTKPGEEGTKPGEEGTKPGEEGTKPGEEGTKPGEEGTKPGEEGTKPGEGENKPEDAIIIPQLVLVDVLSGGKIDLGENYSKFEVSYVLENDEQTIWYQPLARYLSPIEENSGEGWNANAKIVKVKYDNSEEELRIRPDTPHFEFDKSTGNIYVSEYFKYEYKLKLEDEYEDVQSEYIQIYNEEYANEVYIREKVTDTLLESMPYYITRIDGIVIDISDEQEIDGKVGRWIKINEYGFQSDDFIGEDSYFLLKEDDTDLAILLNDAIIIYKVDKNIICSKDILVNESSIPELSLIDMGSGGKIDLGENYSEYQVAYFNEGTKEDDLHTIWYIPSAQYLIPNSSICNEQGWHKDVTYKIKVKYKKQEKEIILRHDIPHITIELVDKIIVTDDFRNNCEYKYGEKDEYKPFENVKYVDIPNEDENTLFIRHKATSNKFASLPFIAKKNKIIVIEVLDTMKNSRKIIKGLDYSTYQTKIFTVDCETLQEEYVTLGKIGTNVEYDEISKLLGKVVTLYSFGDGSTIKIQNVFVSDAEVAIPRHAPNMYIDWYGQNYYDSISIDWYCDQDALCTYWAVHNWSGGYAGFQNKDGNHVLLLSLWDLSDGTTPTVEYALNGNSGVFGGEGTGKQVFTNYDWKVGEWYTMRVDISNDENKTYFTQWIKEIDGEWLKTACISYPLGNYKFTKISTFQEDYRFNNEMRSCRVRNATAKIQNTDKWEEFYNCIISNSFFPTDDATWADGVMMNINFNCDWKVENDYVWIQSGGEGFVSNGKFAPDTYILN